jgi:phytoene synthase
MLDTGAISTVDLLEMISGRETEAYETLADVAEWLAYLDAAFGAVAVAIGRALGADEDERARLRQLGAGYGAVGVLLGVSALAGQGRCLLPEGVLGAHGLTRDDVLHDPRVARPVIDALSEHAARLLQAGAGPYRGAVVAAALPAVLARRDLARTERVRGLGDKLAVLWAGLTGRA